MKSSKSHKHSLDDEENLPHYTPQYATTAKGSLLSKKMKQQSDLRKSAHIQGGFTDLRNVNIC